jgi:hypothetical protein
MSNVAELKFNESTGKYEAIYKGQVLAASASKSYVIENITTGKCNKANRVKVDRVVEPAGQMIVEGVAAPKEDRFSINERFGFLGDFTRMIAKRKSPSLVVTGEGGLGKTFTVLDELGACKLINSSDISTTQRVLKESFEGDEDEAEDSDYEDVTSVGIGSSQTMEESESRKYFVVIKGYTTAKALYSTLYHNHNRIVVFDDCDSVLRDTVALNLLKGALDSYDKRIISWGSAGFINDGLPSSFEFKGGVIFISNLPHYKIDQAVRSRSITVDLSMNADQKLQRMETIIESPKFLPGYEMKAKKLALDFLKEMKDVAHEMNFRTLIQVTKFADEGDKNWKRRAEYCLTNAN